MFTKPADAYRAPLLWMLHWHTSTPLFLGEPQHQATLTAFGQEDNVPTPYTNDAYQELLGWYASLSLSQWVLPVVRESAGLLGQLIADLPTTQHGNLVHAQTMSAALAARVERELRLQGLATTIAIQHQVMRAQATHALAYAGLTSAFDALKNVLADSEDARMLIASLNAIQSSYSGAAMLLAASQPQVLGPLTELTRAQGVRLTQSFLKRHDAQRRGEH